MATYIQGVQDYIPQFQPFQPDLNLYANVLQTKQTQYDTAWKSLNNVYGQYFYSDLTRDNNVQRKDEILKNIDFNLKRVSGLDLSLEQNINQAVQVFKPFYEDKYLMKDMAWTKNYMNQKSTAEGYKNSEKEDVRSQYWGDGVRALDYMREEFKDASDSDSLSFQNAEYTPYVNVTKVASKIAKDAGLSIEKVDFSEDGRWIIKNTNGEQLIEPLSKLFEAQLGNDPGVQAVYQTQAYVNRKDYAYANAAQFGGDKNAAEMKYLENSFNVLKEQSQARYKALQDSSNVYQAQITDIKKQIQNGNRNPKLKTALSQYEQALQINNSVLSRVEKDNDMLNEDENRTGSTSGFINPYGDLKSLRYKVDNGMASMLMQKDLDEAAQIFAYKGAKVDIDANPYAVKAEEHAYRMQEANLRGQYMLKAAEMRNTAQREISADKLRVEQGTHRYDTEAYLTDENGNIKYDQKGNPMVNPMYMRAVPIEAFENVITEQDTEGVTGRINSKEMDAKINRLKAQQITPVFNNAIGLVTDLINQGVMSETQANEIFGMDYKAFSRQIAASPTWFLSRSLGPDKLVKINNKLKNWITDNSNLSALDSSQYQSYKASTIAFDDYAGYLKESQKWKKETSIQVEKELAKNGFKYAYLLYDNSGNIRTEDQFYDAIKAHHGVDISGNQEELKKATMKYMSTNPKSAGIITQGMMDKFTPEEYTEIKKAAASVYTSGRIPVKNVVGLDQFGDLSGTGKFTTGRSTTFVNPKGVNTRSMALFGKALQDLEKFDWGDTTKNRVSLSGVSAADWDNAEKMNRGDFGKTILSLIRSEINNPKTKMGNFKLQVAPVAGGSINKAAIIITPDAEWLKQFVYKTDKNGKKIGEGMLSPNAYDNAINNGISYIMDSKEMSNPMYTNAFSSPLKAQIDATGSYTYNDIEDPNKTFTITPSKFGTGGYDFKVTYPVYLPSTGELKYETIVNPSVPDPDAGRKAMFDYFEINKAAINGGY